MGYKILRLPAVKNQTGRSRSAIYQGMSQGKFPKQINLGVRSVGWLQTDIDNWIESKISESHKGRS